MATPARMVELKCPKCQSSHWEIDCDYRGSGPEPELSYEERTYDCPACNEATAGFRVLQRSPIEFFFQPDRMDPMTTHEFAHWLSVFRTHFPTDDRLKSVGVFWYPGEDDEQTWKLEWACEIGVVQGYRLSLSNRGPDDERIRVYVQGPGGSGHAEFWCGSGVDLDICFGFEQTELEQICQLLAASTSEIQQAWQRFSSLAHEARAGWLPKLLEPTPHKLC